MASIESGSLLRLVIDALPVGVVLVDPNGDILLSNPAAQQIWGDRLLRSGGERWRRSRGWWHDSGVALEHDEWASARAIADGKPHLDQLVDIEAFDGSKRTIRNSAVPILDGSVHGAVIVFEDVTERLRLADRLAQSQKLEAVGRLAGGVAHDFNNLLTVITTYVDVTLDTLPSDDPRHEDLTHVRDAARSATGLTRQLLAFARRESTPAKEIVVEDELRRLARMLEVLVGESVRLELQLDSRQNRIRIDPSQLEQIIFNLALNARDAMPEGGELSVQTRTVDRPDGAHVRLTIRDNGSGMDASVRQRVFEPLFTTKPKGRGTGLGLATVYAIVRDLGGAIALESEPGRGTTFSVELPIAPPAD